MPRRKTRQTQKETTVEVAEPAPMADQESDGGYSDDYLLVDEMCEEQESEYVPSLHLGTDVSQIALPRDPRPVSPDYVPTSPTHAPRGQRPAALHPIHLPKDSAGVVVTVGTEAKKATSRKRKREASDSPENIVKCFLETQFDVSDGINTYTDTLPRHLGRVMSSVGQILHTVTPLATRINELEAKVRGMTLLPAIASQAPPAPRTAVAHTLMPIAPRPLGRGVAVPAPVRPAPIIAPRGPGIGMIRVAPRPAPATTSDQATLLTHEQMMELF